MKLFVLGTGLLRRADSVLLVRCQYENEPHPLWALPGGGHEAGETLAATVRREFLEETSLEIEVADVAYVSESVDTTRDLHVINCTFWVSEADPSVQPHSADPKIVQARFVPIAQSPSILQADVIRIPVTAALRGQTQPHYYSFSEKDITVPFFGRHNATGYEDVGARLVACVPEFESAYREHISNNNNETLNHVLFGDLQVFTEALCAKLRQKQETKRAAVELLGRIFSFIEMCVRSPDPRVRELAVVSFLNMLSPGSSCPELRRFMGPGSRRALERYDKQMSELLDS